MIITKPSNIELLKHDFNEIVVKNTHSKYSLSYASPNYPNENVGFVDCKENYLHFIDCIEWLNEQKMSALIQFDEYGIKKLSLPYHITPKLAVTYEGIYQKAEDFLKSLSHLEKEVDDWLKDDTIKWLIDECLKYDDCLVFMNAAGDFTYFNDTTQNFLIKNGISYIKHRFFGYQTVENFMVSRH